MISIAIAEDMAFERDILLKCLKRYEKELGDEIACSVFENGEELLKNYHQGFDILLLDVAMPEIDGMTAAKRIRRHDERVIIIFITSMVQYAIQGYSVDALDFIVKPVSYTSLKLRLDRALRRLRSQKDKCLEVRSEGSLFSVSVHDILYVETYSHRIIIHTQERALLTNMPMKQLESALSGYPFFRCHTSFLVNLSFVERIQGNDLLLNGKLLPVSRYRRRELLDAWTAYMGDSI